MAASEKTPIEQMDRAITKLLEKYQDTIDVDLDIITKRMGQKGALALRQASAETFTQHTGKYAAGWTYTQQRSRHGAGATIYNKVYTLPHLLENSHVIRNGTQRVVSNYRGRDHIKPIADELTSRFEKEVQAKL